MKLNNLKPASGSVKNKKRIARGVGSGRGRTATRGHKGAKSRSGYSNKREFEGGQMPLQKLVPKRGFKNTHRRYQSSRPSEFKALNLSQLEYYSTKHNLTEVNPSLLAELGVVVASKAFKVLGNGSLTKALEVTAVRFSETAKKAIVAAGGKAFVEVKLNTVQGVAHAESVEHVNHALLVKHLSYVSESDMVHVVAEGQISTKLTIEAHKISVEAKSQVEGLGGSVVIL
jgi:large subunit ribosomal protein L15